MLYSELRGTRLHGDGGNGWTELNGCMMALELPGIYIRPEKNLFYAFDHVDVKMLKSNQQEMLLSITNTTPFDAEISILSESEQEATQPLSSVAFIDWKKIKVKAGKTIEYRIKK